MVVTAAFASPSSRLRRGPTLLVAHLRLAPWSHLALGALVAFGLAWQLVGDAFASRESATQQARVIAILLAVATAATLDDPTEEDLSAAPVPVVTRRLARLALVGTVVAAAWAGCLAVLSTAPALVGGPRAVLPEGHHLLEFRDVPAPWPAPPVEATLLPIWGLTIEFVGLVLAVLATAAVVTRRGGVRGGLVAGPIVLVAAFVLFPVPPPWGLFVPWVAAPTQVDLASLGADHAWHTWVDVHRRWGGIALLGLVALLVASRDRARPSLRAAVRRARAAGGRGPARGRGPALGQVSPTAADRPTTRPTARPTTTTTVRPTRGTP